MCMSSGPSAPPPPPPPTKLKELPGGGQVAPKRRKVTPRSLKIENAPGTGLASDEEGVGINTNF